MSKTFYTQATKKSKTFYTPYDPTKEHKDIWFKCFPLTGKHILTCVPESCLEHSLNVVKHSTKEEQQGLYRSIYSDVIDFDLSTTNNRLSYKFNRGIVMLYCLRNSLFDKPIPFTYENPESEDNCNTLNADW